MLPNGFMATPILGTQEVRFALGTQEVCLTSTETHLSLPVDSLPGPDQNSTLSVMLYPLIVLDNILFYFFKTIYLQKKSPAVQLGTGSGSLPPDLYIKKKYIYVYTYRTDI